MYLGMDFQAMIQRFALSVVPFLLAITVHELMHGYVAFKLGDNTAKDAGRLTLNPIAHIDIFGLLFLLVTQMFGWAKPVPVNFYRLKHKYGIAIVSAAGPLANLVLATISSLVLSLFEILVLNVAIPSSIVYPVGLMLLYSVMINVALFVFNLLPIMPFDGGRILYNFLPRHLAIKFESTERYGFIIVLLLFFTGIMDKVLSPMINFIYYIII